MLLVVMLCHAMCQGTEKMPKEPSWEEECPGSVTWVASSLGGTWVRLP